MILMRLRGYLTDLTHWLVFSSTSTANFPLLMPPPLSPVDPVDTIVGGVIFSHLNGTWAPSLAMATNVGAGTDTKLRG